MREEHHKRAVSACGSVGLLQLSLFQTVCLHKEDKRMAN